MTPRQAESRGTQPPATATPLTTSTDQDTDHHHHHRSGDHRRRRDIPTVAAEVLPPAGRRRLPAPLVRRRPTCECAHLHRGGPGVRRSSCSGSEYRIVAISVEGVAA